MSSTISHMPHVLRGSAQELSGVIFGVHLGVSGIIDIQSHVKKHGYCPIGYSIVKERNPIDGRKLTGMIDSWTNSFLPDRRSLWDASLEAQGVPIKVRRDEQDSFCDVETMVTRMDEIGMASLILPVCDLPAHAGITDYEGFATRVDEMDAMSAAHPGRFVGQWSVDPREGSKGLDRAREMATKPWIVALHTHTHSFDLPFDHADYYPFYALAHELGIPFVMQAGTSGGRLPSACGHPIGIDRPAIYFPQVNFRPLAHRMALGR